MARPRLRSPDQPFLVRFVLGLYEFSASLRLAVLLIVTMFVVLGWATFVESEYGTQAVQFGIYGAWWFTLLGALLALNIFAAAVIRYPWKRYQTGFVITHLGLLTLLLGCLLSRRGGIDAQMPIVEGDAGTRAFEDSQHFELAILPHDSKSQSHSHTADGKPSSHELVDVINVPFASGPFNWSDYKDHFFFPWALAKRDQGVIYDRDGIKLEVLDYYSNCEQVNAPHLRLKLSNLRIPRPGLDGKERLPPESWNTIDLAVRKPSQSLFKRSVGQGMGEQVGGGQIVFWLASTDAETKAFLESAPDTALGLGDRGQVVLYAGGQKFTFLVADRVGQPPLPLGETGLTAEVVAYYATAVRKADSAGDRLEVEDAKNSQGVQNPAVEILIRRGDESPQRMLLFALVPEFNQPDDKQQVFGSYWFDQSGQTSEQLMKGIGGSRIDIVQGQDEKLYYRYWNRSAVAAVGELPTDGTPVDAFKMPKGQLRMKVDRLVSARKPEVKVLPKPFQKDMNPTGAFRAAHVRATVDGKSEEFWLVGEPPKMLGEPAAELAEHVVVGDKRSVALRLPLDEIDFGCKIRLDQFERNLDPGTSQAAHYGSQIAFLKIDEELSDPGLKHHIMMNAPVDFSDPRSGKSYRLFQESFAGPFAKGTHEYELAVQQAPRASESLPDEIYVSTLTVNYDPGRGVKYIGCGLVIAGIFTMFYMRAYFFPQKERNGRLSQRNLR